MSQFLNRDQNDEEVENLVFEISKLKEENRALRQLNQSYLADISELELQLTIYANREKVDTNE